VSLYPLKVALSGIWREKWINFLCILSIATGLFLVASAIIIVYNIDRAVVKLPERFSVAVFLEDGVTEDGARDIIREIKKDPSVRRAEYISSSDALKDLRAAMKDADYVLEGLDENPLPASLDVKLRKGSVTDESVRDLAVKLKGIKGVADVEYGKKLLSVIQSASKHSAMFSAVLVGSLVAGILFVCYSTVKILLYRKKEEIETLKLLGATKRFIRSPFIIEGGILGLLGGAISTAALILIYYLVFSRLAETMPVARAIGAPPELLAYTPVAGGLIGIVGAFIAMGRVRF
jgi:cell division transport system permease protein